MSMIPSVSTAKRIGIGLFWFGVSAWAITRFTPGFAAFVGLNPGGSAIPNGSILTPPNVNELMGRRTAAAAPAQSSVVSIFTPQGQNNIIDGILA